MIKTFVLLSPNFFFFVQGFSEKQSQVIGIQLLAKMIRLIVVPLQGTSLDGFLTPGLYVV